MCDFLCCTCVYVTTHLTWTSSGLLPPSRGLIKTEYEARAASYLSQVLTLPTWWKFQSLKRSWIYSTNPPHKAANVHSILFVHRVPVDSPERRHTPPKPEDVWIYKESCIMHAKLIRCTNRHDSLNTHVQTLKCGKSSVKLFEVGQGLLGPESVNKSGSVWVLSSGRTLN